jgi:glycine cleavage system transcriptional repressor
MHEFAITVIGHDRPGIIADVTTVLADLGLNLTDSTMTLLRGHFAMTLICAGDVDLAVVEGALRPLVDGGSLMVSVREVAAESAPAPRGGNHVLSLHGADRLGIVAAVTRVLAGEGGNITDLTTRLTAGLYVLIAEVDLPASADLAAINARLRGVATELGVEVSLRPADTDLL